MTEKNKKMEKIIYLAPKTEIFKILAESPLLEESVVSFTIGGPDVYIENGNPDPNQGWRTAKKNTLWDDMDDEDLQ